MQVFLGTQNGMNPSQTTFKMESIWKMTFHTNNKNSNLPLKFDMYNTHMCDTHIIKLPVFVIFFSYILLDISYQKHELAGHHH